MIVDFIPFAYRGTMRDYNGDLFEVDWFIVTDPSAAVMEFTHPFRSMYGDTWRPFDLGAVGEIPQWYPQRSRLHKPPWVCNNCYSGSKSFWQNGWPIGTPGLLILDGFAVACQAQSFETAASKEQGAFTAIQSGVFPEELPSKQKGSFESFPSVSSLMTAGSKQGCTFTTTEATVSFLTAASKESGTLSQSATVIEYATGLSKQSATISESASVSSTMTAASKEQATLTSVLGVSSTMTAASKQSGSLTGASSWMPYSSGNLSATGSIQTTAATVTKDITLVQTTTSNTGVIMPSSPGVYYVRSDPTNSGLNTLKIYPPVGGTIGGLSTNTPLNPAAGNSYIIVSYDGIHFCESQPIC